MLPPEATPHIWRREARNKGQVFPDVEAGPEGWRSRDKFAAVLEAAALNEADLVARCRERGLYPEQIKAWRQARDAADDRAQASTAKGSQTSREERKRIKALERELAKAAALLVLTKQAAATRGEEKDK